MMAIFPSGKVWVPSYPKGHLATLLAFSISWVEARGAANILPCLGQTTAMKDRIVSSKTSVSMLKSAALQL